MENIYGEKGLLSEQFEQTYGDILDELSRMERASVLNRERRWEWFIAHQEYDELWMKAFEAYDPGLARTFTKRTDPESERTIEAFSRAFKEAVMDYTAVFKEGKRMPFIAHVGIKARHYRAKLRGAENYDNNGVPMPRIPENKKYIVEKLASAVLQLKAALPDLKSDEELLQIVLEESAAASVTKKERDAILLKVRGLNLSRSLQDSVGEEGDSRSTLENFTADKNDRIQNVIDQEADRQIYGEYLKYLALFLNKEKKEVIHKVPRDFLRAFLTKDILIRLKLDTMTEPSDALQTRKKELLEEKKRKLEAKQNGPLDEEALKEIKAEIEDMFPGREPRCGQWCPKRNGCEQKEKPGWKEGCYTRFTMEPAGDEKFYQDLEPFGLLLYERILSKVYIDRAIESSPADMYEVYANMLREDFLFTDAVLGEALNIKSKSTVSRKRAEYEETAKGELMKEFEKMRSEGGW